MNVLKNKSRISSAHISRYAPFPIYYHTLDKKYVAGITSQLLKETPFVEVIIDPEDTLDSLANKYYGRPDYYWIIADFNSILDPFIKIGQYYTKIKIPALAAIEYRK